MKIDRKSIRLKDYDYSQSGAYFITICTYDRKCLFGEIVNDEMELNDYGKIIEKEWLRSDEIRKEIKLDVFQVMPNHFHAIVWIVSSVEANGRSPLPKMHGCSPLTKRHDRPPLHQRHGRPLLHKGQRPKMKPKSLSSLMSGFESSTTSKINTLRSSPRVPVLQSNYYDHVVRNERELQRIREYIQNNPLKWALDRENPESVNFNMDHDLYWKDIYDL